MEDSGPNKLYNSNCRTVAKQPAIKLQNYLGELVYSPYSHIFTHVTAAN
jgi:hypothetical protein